MQIILRKLTYSLSRPSLVCGAAGGGGGGQARQDQHQAQKEKDLQHQEVSDGEEAEGHIGATAAA